MPAPLAIAAIAAPIIGGIAGNLLGKGDRDAARAAIERAYQEAMSLGMPPDLAKEVILKQFSAAGVMTPEMEQDINLGPSETAAIKEDPTGRDAQVQALQLLQQKGRGLDATDRASFNKLRSETQRDSEAKRQQILQNFAMRGQGGSGGELAAQLMQAQSSANQASDGGDQIAATSASNALAALRDQGALSGNIRGTDLDLAKTKANAADEFQRFNTQAQMNRQTNNIGARNDAQAANLQNAQNISNQNTQQANNESLRQNQAQRDYWDDQLKRTTLRSNAAAGQASQFAAEADRTAAQWAGAGAGIGAGAGAFANRSGKKSSGGDGSTPLESKDATKKYGNVPTSGFGQA